MKCYKKYIYSFVPFRLWVLCLLFSFLIMTNGCVSQKTLEKIRVSSEKTALSTKATAEILGKANKEVDGVDLIIKTLNKNFKDIPKQEPFKIPEWVKILGGLIAMLLVPDFAKKASQGVKGAVLIIKKVSGKT